MKIDDVKLGAIAHIREWKVLHFVYTSDERVGKYDVFKKFTPDTRQQKEYEVALFDLHRQGLIEDERIDYDIFIAITDKGRNYLESHYISEVDKEDDTNNSTRH